MRSESFCVSADTRSRLWMEKLKTNWRNERNLTRSCTKPTTLVEWSGRRFFHLAQIFLSPNVFPSLALFSTSAWHLVMKIGGKKSEVLFTSSELLVSQTLDHYIIGRRKSRRQSLAIWTTLTAPSCVLSLFLLDA